MADAGKEFSAKNIEIYFENNNEELIDKKMVYRYLDKMEKACLIDRVKRFNIVGKQALAYVEKQYAVDTAFRMINTNFINIEDTGSFIREKGDCFNVVTQIINKFKIVAHKWIKEESGDRFFSLIA